MARIFAKRPVPGLASGEDRGKSMRTSSSGRVLSWLSCSIVALLIAATFQPCAAADNGCPNGYMLISSMNWCGSKFGHDVTEKVCVDKSCGVGPLAIKPGGELFFPNRRVNLKLPKISVEGVMRVGTAAAPIDVPEGPGEPDAVQIIFTGQRPQNPVAEAANEPCPSRSFNKGIEVCANGTVEMFGRKGVPIDATHFSWTVLSQPAGDPKKFSKDNDVLRPVLEPDAKTLHVADDVSKDWQKNDWIAVATTSYSPFETEFVQIKSVANDGTGAKIELKDALHYYHFGSNPPTKSQLCTVGGVEKAVACGSVPACKSECNSAPSSLNFHDGADQNYGVDERAEVALISRDIRLTAEDTDLTGSTHWGGEIIARKGFKEFSIQGVEIEKFGKDKLGSYPIHFHMDGDVGNQPIVNANSVHHSYNKCVTVHSTQNLTISNNVCARVVGHGYYEEWGDEDNITFSKNLALGVLSNIFDIHAETPQARKKLIDNNWWVGDNIANPDAFHYDGFNIPDTDNQQNPARGGCAKVNQDGSLSFADPDALPYGQPPTNYKNCPPTEVVDNVRRDLPFPYYEEPPTGFWLTNPTAKLLDNSVGGCQGIGRGYWYASPKQDRKADPVAGTPAVIGIKFKPVGRFHNNRVHACLDGLWAESEFSTQVDQLFPQILTPKIGPGDISVNRPLLAEFEGLTATRIRKRGVWLRPDWFFVHNGRFATDRQAVSLVSSGGNDGNPPGVWALLKDSVLVGLSENNVDRFGPCPTRSDSGLSGKFGCIDQTPIPNGQPLTSGDQMEDGYPDAKFTLNGYLIYDGPVRIFSDRFVNYNVKISDQLTKTDQSYLSGAEKGLIGGAYEGDAALGWFPNNQSSYPTSTATQDLYWENTDLRHQIFTEKVNLGDFKDGDQNTVILDRDATLAGLQVATMVNNVITPLPFHAPYSLNNLPFNKFSNAIDECLSEGQQNTNVEGRPTSLMSPGDIATLEFGNLFPANMPHKRHDQTLTFTKDDASNYGARQKMLLTGRDGRGLWEPKVNSGFGYSVQASQGIASHALIGPPDMQVSTAAVDIGLTDAVKPDLDATHPFFVRIGICYSSSGANPHPTDPNVFAITRGYKTWGGAAVEPTDLGLRNFWNELVFRYKMQFCKNLDSDLDQNLVPMVGCPANGVTSVPMGGCPAGTTMETDQGNLPACIYPKTTLQPAGAGKIDELMNGAQPVLDKYYYNPDTGMLYFNVVQDIPNPDGASPLGACLTSNKALGCGSACPAGSFQRANPDCSCTDNPCPNPESDDPKVFENYYTCPAPGCVAYTVMLNDPSYVPAGSTCDVSTSPELRPANQNFLAYKGGAMDGQKVTSVEMGGAFPHSVASPPQTCPVTQSP